MARNLMQEIGFDLKIRKLRWNAGACFRIISSRQSEKLMLWTFSENSREIIDEWELYLGKQHPQAYQLAEKSVTSE